MVLRLRLAQFVLACSLDGVFFDYSGSGDLLVWHDAA